MLIAVDFGPSVVMLACTHLQPIGDLRITLFFVNLIKYFIMLCLVTPVFS